MPILALTDTEYDYYVQTLREEYELIGQDGYLYQVDVDTVDLYQDPQTLYKKPTKICMVFDDNPRPIIKKNNWFTEDGSLPFVAHVVNLDSEGNKINIIEHMIIRIPSVHGLKTDRFFYVTHVLANHIDPWEWVISLVPYRDKVDMVPETDKTYDRLRDVESVDSGYGYLKMKR